MTAGVVPSRRERLGRLLVSAWIVGFLGLHVASFVFRLGPVHLLYPFSNLDFFAKPAAKRPYDRYQGRAVDLGQISVLDGGEEVFVQPRNVDLITRYRGNDKAWKLDGSLEERIGLAAAACAQVLAERRLRRLGSAAWYGPGNPEEVRFWGATFHFPPHPEPAGWRLAHRGLVGACDVRTRRVRAVHAEPLLSPPGLLGGLSLVLAGFDRPEGGAVHVVPSPYVPGVPADPRPLGGAWSFGPPDADGRTPARFVPAVPARVRRNAELLIEVREGGDGRAYRFRGPALAW